MVRLLTTNLRSELNLLIFGRHNPSQSMCKVELKDEFSDDNEEHSDGPIPAKRTYTANQSLQASQHNGNGSYLTTSTSDDQPSLSINNVAATLDTLKLLKNGQFATSVTKVSTATSNNSVDEVGSSNADLMICSNGELNGGSVNSTRIFLEMQNKEHLMRMEILQVQLQTAKYNRDAAEINKMIAMRNLSIATATQNDGGGGQHNGDGAC